MEAPFYNLTLRCIELEDPSSDREELEGEFFIQFPGLSLRKTIDFTFIQ
ncbi:hypothetical protein SAMN05421807_104159 [Virgibacillus chiguensis]|uniref:Uncharacterized protein n=1 Tax=Virgibacillus chiguensis TaxID=411959 RepID=A0A1M5QJQ4_9BACI|nr:hypothetical protein SAMN05421807_104159 [Virgibacillus chiguensis]